VRIDKEVLKECHRWGEPISKIEGKIKEFEIRENGVWLVFMTEYLAAVDAAERVEREIAETDQEIDARVYALYGLGADEIRVVEGG
jgi:hypothetical protein